jgi:hypothetical protein
MSAHAPQSSDSLFTVEQLNRLYLVPRGHPSPEAVRASLDATLRDRLNAAFLQVMPAALDPADPSVWLIRRLDIDFALDTSVVADDLLARTFAGRIAQSIVRAIARGADGERVLHFPNRAAYLAQFVGDLAEGRAWDKWYYGAFDSLRSLPFAAAAREALTREPQLAEEALLQLSARGRLERVLEAVNERDARAIYDACLRARKPSQASANVRSLIAALVAAWPAASVRAGASGVARAPNSLRLYLALRRAAPALASDANVDEAIRHLLGFAEVLRRAKAPATLVASLASGDLRSAIDVAREGGAAAEAASLVFIERAAAGEREWVSRVANALSPTAATSARHDDSMRGQTLSTLCGGLFLLLPSLIELGLAELTEAAPYEAPEGSAKAEVLRLCLALKWLGRPLSTNITHDPGLQLFTGSASTPLTEDLEALSLRATGATERRCRLLLLEALTGRGRADGRMLSAALLSVKPYRERILLLRDAAHDAWLCAERVSTEAGGVTSALARGLALVREAVGAPPLCLLLEDGLEVLTDLADFEGVPLVWVERPRALSASPLAIDAAAGEPPRTIWVSQPAALPADAPRLLARHLAHSARAAADLEYLSLLNLLPDVAADFDLTWNLMARAVLRHFTGRLSGFQRNSAEYIYRNFLAGTSVVRDGGEGIEIQLPPAPLQIILRMAGVDGQTFSVPWLNDEQVRLSLMIE